MSDLDVRNIDDLFVLFENGAPVESPAGTPLWSRSRPLMAQILSDAEVFGTDPALYPSLVCLQFSYLDFGLPNEIEALIGCVLPSLQALAEARFGGAAVEIQYMAAVDAGRQTLANYTKRQLISVIVGSSHLGSASIAMRLVDSAATATIPQLARGLCGRSVEGMAEHADYDRIEPPVSPWPAQWDLGDTARWAGVFGDAGDGQWPVMPPELRYDTGEDRFVPEKMDDAFCVKECGASALVERPDVYRDRCAMAHVLRRLQEFAVQPEEED